MSVLYWSSARRRFSWIVCIYLLSISTSYGEELEEEVEGAPDLKEPNTGSLRLVNGTESSGRLEIFYEGEWGTICNDGWSNNEADVACRSLGFGNGVPLTVSEGSGKIFLADVKCAGNEDSIVACHNNNFQQHDCTHKSDAGVSCEGVLNALTDADTYTDTDDICTFDRGSCGYSIYADSSFRWVRKSGSTGSSNTGPTFDHTRGTYSGYYMYTEASSGSTGSKTSLYNNFPSRWVHSLRFWYHMYGVNMGTLNVNVRTNRHIEMRVWSRKGNQGNFWRYTCIPIKSTIKRVSFEGIRGPGFTGDMAIDDVYLSPEECSAMASASCDFTNGWCAYQSMPGNDSSVNWGLTPRGPIGDHTPNKHGSYASVNVNYPKEGMKAYLMSQPFSASTNMKIEFYYYLENRMNLPNRRGPSGSTPGALQVSFKDKSTPLDSWSENDWQDYGDHGNTWNYGCMDLHAGNGNSSRVVFTAITGTLPGITLALDDIKMANGSCGMGIDDFMCTFDNPKLCHYKINCTARQEYTWRRIRGSTSSLRTGPTRDASKLMNGYYLYAESSYGNAGDAVSIKFPVKDTKGKYLKFNYHMYGQSMGSLHLRYSSGKSSSEEWQISGNQGNSWKSFCTRVDSEIDAITLVAVRGYRYTSDIAVDNVFLDTKPCPNDVNCDFESGMCNYTLSGTNRYFYWKIASGPVHTSGSLDGLTNYGRYLMATNPSGMESATTSIETPVIKHTSNESSLQFYYKSDTSTDSGKLMVQLNYSALSFNMGNMMETKHLRMNEDGWIIGCVDLPPDDSVSATFTAISGTTYKSSIMLDDIYYSEAPCVVGIVNNVCTFDEPNECGYNVSCREASQFLWKRGMRTNSSSTGPTPDNNKGYFMYTESSMGSPGDTTDLEFPEFVTPPGHYLSFYYNMNGRDIGALQVSVITPAGKMLKWVEKGSRGLGWHRGCVNLPVNERTTVVFTGIRGNGPLGDIAIDNVAVVSGVCHERNMACDFTDELLCGYRNTLHGTGWIRRKSGSGYHITVRSNSGMYGIISPLRNLTDNCVQITYKITGRMCEMDVYTTYDNKKHLSLQSLQTNDTDWETAQFYIAGAETELLFNARVNNWYYSCSVKIEQIEISNGTCPALVCPGNSSTCNDQTQCIAGSFTCDRADTCLDGSDETNCPQSISCDFEHQYLCGYTYPHGWYHTKLDRFTNPDLHLENSEYALSLNSGTSNLTSPKSAIQDSCLQFNYAGGTGSYLQVMAIYGDGKKSPKWDFRFTDLTKWTIGQFQLSAGNVYLQFRGSANELGIMIDNIVLTNGTCGRIACLNDSFACVSNEKCVPSKNKCNRKNDCTDKSDELNCPTSLACDVEDPYQCGYEYTPGTWSVASGRSMRYPDLDHSRGSYTGRYFASSIRFFNGSKYALKAPEETLPRDACLTFYYSFHGSGEFEILDNKKSMLVIRPNNVNTWQKSQIQLKQGRHNVAFIHKEKDHYNATRQYNVLALDSIELTNGSCGVFECEDGWMKCPTAPICIPEFKFCDHDVDCPNGEDEKNCRTYSNIHLVGGRNVQQGFVEFYTYGEWMKTCGRWYQDEYDVACRELGFNGTARIGFKTQGTNYDKTSGHSINCNGYEDSILSCRSVSCTSRSPIAIDCSNTHCESTHVPCADFNATTYDNSSASNTTMCIPKDSVCDGEKDCPGGTDELSCPKCGAQQFQCLNYECIEKKLRCDGNNDCQDGSDEYRCMKHEKNTLKVLYFTKYLPVCEDNLKDQDVANRLCTYVGKGNASVGVSNTKSNGMMFYKKDTEQSIFPGFLPTYATMCNVLNLDCSRRECGTRSPNLYDPLIQHGHQALAGEFPWQVALYARSRFNCGGTLIGDRYVLTAAHCVRDSSNPRDYAIYVGSTLRFGGRSHSVRRVMPHKEFSMQLLRNDIAVLELTSPVQISDYVRTACLPSKPWTPDTQCFTTGWGRLENRSSTNYLMETKVSLMSRDECRQHYSKSDRTTVCANHKQPNQPGCYGDSGGPLICRNEQGYWEVIGVTSYGRVQCAGHQSSPQVYADVFTFRNWVLDRMA